MDFHRITNRGVQLASNSRTPHSGASTTITLFDIPVPFPFEPYPVQVRYMQEVIETLLTPGRNALLESPTGTGKTLCLLSACLAWQQRQVGSDRPKIIYASRTHAQLSQVSRELRKTCFPSRGVTGISIGSRDHLCVNVNVLRGKSQGKTLLGKCRAEVETKSCGQYTSLLQSRGTAVAAPKTVMDIEEVRGYGNRSHLCAYYLSREMAKYCDVVFVPYNYLFDEEALKSMELDISGSVVLVDEAHNIEKVCEEVASVQLDLFDFSLAKSELSHAAELADTIQEIGAATETKRAAAISSLDNVVSRLAMAIKERATETAGLALTDRPLAYRDLLSLLQKAKISRSNYAAMIDAIDLVDKIFFAGVADNKQIKPRKTTAPVALSKIKKLLFTVFEFCDSADTFARHFRAFVMAETPRQLVNTDSGRAFVLFVWCFSPALTMKSLVATHKIRNLIITSGTLAPLPTFAASMGIPFEVQLVNQHVIEPKRQLLAGIVSMGPKQIPLNASFKDRENRDYLEELANVLVSVSRSVPEGLLVAFASYAQLERVLNHFDIAGTFGRIAKRVFRESKESGQEVGKLMAEYGDACTRPNEAGAILFCVARGRLSEGVDFSDAQCRCVMMVGIPFANAMDKRVAMKKDFLDFQTPRGGDNWYRIDAMRAVNQTIGRVIRHKHDYGAILLCDERFVRMKADLPAWTSEQVATYMDFGQLTQDLHRFFDKDAATRPHNPQLGLKRQHSDHHVDAIFDRQRPHHPRSFPSMARTLGTLEIGQSILQCKPHQVGNPLVRHASSDPPAAVKQTTATVNPFAKENGAAGAAAANTSTCRQEQKRKFYELARSKLPTKEYSLFKATLLEFITQSSSKTTADLSVHYRTFRRILEPYDEVLSALLVILNPAQVAAFYDSTASSIFSQN